MTPGIPFIEWEFRYRIVISLGIVLAACVCAYVLWIDPRTLLELTCGDGWKRPSFVIAAGLCLLATVLRMSGGTVLRSNRVMSFDIRAERLAIEPPFTLVRNPIYLSDIIASVGFSLCMPAPGLMYPVLLSCHYRSLIDFEERNLEDLHSTRFPEYRSVVPRLVPTIRSTRSFLSGSAACRIDRDGFRYNALYLLFVPGLLLSAYTGEFFHAVLVGLPAVSDWAYWHTVKGLRHTPREDSHDV